MALPSPAYFRSAAEAGLLHELHGRRYVAGEYVHQFDGRCRCLVEYCDRELVSEQRLRAALESAVRGSHPDAETIIVRLEPDVVPPADWLRHLTYVRTTWPGHAAVPHDIVVVPAEAGHDDLVRGWLMRAFRAAEGTEASESAIAAAADDVLAAPDRRSYVALAEHRPVGHVTLLREQHDDVRDSSYVELLDVLVDAAAQTRRTATRALVERAVAEANAAGRPLLGHVVHPPDAVAGPRSEAVLMGLLADGWSVDHGYWCLPDREESADRDETGPAA